MKRIETLTQDVTSDLMDLAFSRVTNMDNVSYTEVKETCDQFKETFYKKRWAIKPLVDVDYYFTEDIDEFRNSDPRNVDIPGFDYIKRFGKRIPPDTPKRRAEMELYEWFCEWRAAILNDEFFELPPTQLLEDDPFIIIRASECAEQVVVIVTDDRKLCRLASNKLIDKLICRISIKNWVLMDAMEKPIIDTIKQDLKADAIVLVDEGSLDTFLWKTDINPSVYPGWTGRIDLKPPRTQEDIWDVYMPPISIANIYDFVEITDVRKATRIFGRRNRGS
jgi:hypothetical protein